MCFVNKIIKIKSYVHTDVPPTTKTFSTPKVETTADENESSSVDSTNETTTTPSVTKSIRQTSGDIVTSETPDRDTSISDMAQVPSGKHDKPYINQLMKVCTSILLAIRFSILARTSGQHICLINSDFG